MSSPSPILNLNFANAKQLIHPALSVSRASSGSVFGPSGTMRYADNNVPRFDHDPLVGTSLGLLIEPTATFSSTYSDQLDILTTALSGATVTPNTGLSLDGTTTMDSLIETAVSGEHRYTLPTTVLPTVSSILDVEVKKLTGGRNIRLLIADQSANTNSFAAVFNPDTGVWVTAPYASGNATGVTGGIISLPNGNYRVWIAGIPNSSGTQTLARINLINSTSSSYTGDGTSGVLLHRLLSYQGTYPSSTLPTTDSSVIRDTEAALVSLAGLKNNGVALWGGTEGTIVVNFTQKNTIASGGSSTILQIDAGSSQNKITLYSNYDLTIRTQVRVDGTYYSTSSFPIASFPYSGCLVYAFKANSHSASLNGSAVMTNTTAPIPSGFSGAVMRLGHSLYDTNNITFNSVQLYNRRVDDAYLPLLSQI